MWVNVGTERKEAGKERSFFDVDLRGAVLVRRVAPQALLYIARASCAFTGGEPSFKVHLK